MSRPWSTFVLASLALVQLLALTETEALTCNYCVYNGPVLPNNETYPCRSQHKEGIGLMGDEECAQPDAACFLTLAINDRPDGKKNAIVTGGCLPKTLMKCRGKRVRAIPGGEEFAYDFKGGCVTTKMTVKEGEEVNQCWVAPDADRKKRAAVDPKTLPQYRTMCSCMGDSCNGPEGAIKKL